MKDNTCLNIAVKGFWSTGESAVNDFLFEFDNTFGIKQQEMLIFDTIDGIVDLENKYLFNSAPIIIGAQIARFKKLVNFLSKYGMYSLPYDSEEVFGGFFKKRSYEFIDKITSENKLASLEFDYPIIEEHINNFAYKYKIWPFKKQKIDQLLKKISLSLLNYVKPLSHYFPRGDFYIPKGYDNFKKELNDYINDLTSYLSKQNAGKNILYQQLLTPASFNLYKNAIPNLRYIIIDRDPRDIYVFQRHLWKSLAVPNNPQDFAEWYKLARAQLNELEGNFLHIKFEDFVYNYENTSSKIMTFLNLTNEQHVKKLKFFDPSKSIKNTQMWKKTNKYNDEIKILEDLLPEFLYEFPYFEDDNLEGIW
ncbi:sulfotransferase [Lentisphaerota bacterium WC36G]|nr:sulfotransferase [Lentisphaerae bacterium WC36]